MAGLSRSLSAAASSTCGSEVNPCTRCIFVSRSKIATGGPGCIFFRYLMRASRNDIWSSSRVFSASSRITVYAFVFAAGLKFVNVLGGKAGYATACASSAAAIGVCSSRLATTCGLPSSSTVKSGCLQSSHRASAIRHHNVKQNLMRGNRNNRRRLGLVRSGSGRVLRPRHQRKTKQEETCARAAERADRSVP